MKLVSVIIPYYKKKKFIIKTLNSIFNQTYKNFDVILIYDSMNLDDYYFIKKKSQLKVGFYNTKYKYSADYDLFYRMIVKKKMIGTSTKKNEIMGKFRPGGLSKKIRYVDFLKENFQIRKDNGQNKYYLYVIFLLRILRNFKKFIK